MPLLDLVVGRARLVVTDRGTATEGGTATDHGPYGQANLSLSVGDDPRRVVRNRAAVARAVGVSPDSLLFLRQVHGNRVLDPVEVAAEIGSTSPSQVREADRVAADGAVLATPGTAVAVTAADCLPLLLADRSRPVAAVAHVGRRGLALGIVARCVAALATAGGRAPRAVLGPAIGVCCYEVAEHLRAEVGELVPAASGTTRWGTPALDLRAGVRSQLVAAGLAHSDLMDVDVCTHETAGLFSYRRDPVTGRFAGVVALDGS